MSLTAVLLAGGRSRRMGRDKAFLEVGGEPLWKLQVAKLEQLSDEILLSVREAASAIESSHRKIFDPPEAHGPLAGLAGALREASHSHVLVLAVDLPAMTPNFLRALAARISPGRGAVPFAGGFFQGTAAVYPREMLPLVERALASDDRSFQSLFRQSISAGMMEAIAVSEKELPLFANWNTPEEIMPR